MYRQANSKKEKTKNPGDKKTFCFSASFCCNQQLWPLPKGPLDAGQCSHDICMYDVKYTYLFVGKDENSRFTQLVALQHLVELLLVYGQPFPVRAVHHQDDKLKQGHKCQCFQGCIKFPIPPWLGLGSCLRSRRLCLGWGSLSSLLGKNIKFRRGEGNIKGIVNNIAWKKKNGKNILSLLILRLLGRISSKEGALKNFGEEYQVKKTIIIHP